MFELVIISTSELDLQVVVAAGIVTVLSNLNVIAELRVDVVNTRSLGGSLEVENVQIAWWVPKIIRGLTIDEVSIVVIVIGLQFTVVVAINVGGRDVSGEVEIVSVNLCQFKIKLSDVAGAILSPEFEFSGEVIARLFGADLASVFGEHWA